MKINRDGIKMLGGELMEMAEALSKEHGLTCSLKATYGDTTGTVKITFEVIGVDGLSDEQRDIWESYAKFIDDMEAHWFGQKFIHDGLRYQIIGYRPRASKRPVLCCAINGKQTAWAMKSIASKMETM